MGLLNINLCFCRKDIRKNLPVMTWDIQGINQLNHEARNFAERIWSIKLRRKNLVVYGREGLKIDS